MLHFICSKRKQQRAFLPCSVGSPLWGPKPGKELRVFLNEVSTAAMAEAVPGLITHRHRGGGTTWTRSVILPKEQVPGPFPGNPPGTPYPFLQKRLCREPAYPASTHGRHSTHHLLFLPLRTPRNLHHHAHFTDGETVVQAVDVMCSGSQLGKRLNQEGNPGLCGSESLDFSCSKGATLGRLHLSAEAEDLCPSLDIAITLQKRAADERLKRREWQGLWASPWPGLPSQFLWIYSSGLSSQSTSTISGPLGLDMEEPSENATCDLRRSVHKGTAGEVMPHSNQSLV